MILCAGATVTMCGNNNTRGISYLGIADKGKNETEQYRNEMNGAELKQKSNAESGMKGYRRAGKQPTN
jgi:hypothetical protein